METTHDKNKVKYGLLELRQGAQVTITPSGDGKKGRRRGGAVVITIGDKTRFPHAKFVVRCMTCKKEWPNVDEMIAEHPTHGEMADEEQSHPWAWYSDDPAERPQSAPKGATKEQTEAIEAANKALPKIGLVSEAAW